MKRFWPVLIIVALIGACAYLADALWRARMDSAAYAVQVQDAAVAHKDDLAKNDAALAVIEDQNQVIAALTAAAGQPTPAEVEKDQEIAALESKVAAYEAQGDVAGALTAAVQENKAWAEKFDLAAGMHQESLTALNKAWQAKYTAQVSISATWQAAYEREHALWTNCDSLRADLAKQAPAGAFERAAGDAEEIGVGVYAAVRYKDPIPLGAWLGRKLVVKAWKFFHR